MLSRFKLVAIKMVSPSKEHLEKHYEDLSSKPFFKGLVTCMPHLPTSTLRESLANHVVDMLSGPIVAMVWEGRDACKTGRCTSSISSHPS